MRSAFCELPNTSLDVQSLPESSCRMKSNSYRYILRLLQSANQRQKGFFCSYQPLFQDQVLQKSVKIHRSHPICHTTDCIQRHTLQNAHDRPKRVQKHRCGWDSPERRANLPLVYTHLTVLQGLYVS